MANKPDWYTGPDLIDFSSPNQVGTTKNIPELDKSLQLPGKQLIKDFAVDAATQVPLMAFPEAGIPARALMSFGAGTGADQLLNRDKSLGDSALDAATNTTLAMAIPGLLENKVQFAAKPIAGTGASAVPLKIMQVLNPRNWQITPYGYTRPGASKMVPANLGNKVKDLLTNKGMPQAVRNATAAVPAPTLEWYLKNLLGFGSNAAFDTTLNRPQQ